MSSAPWQASTNSDTTFSMTQDEERNDRKGAFAHARETATSRDILLFLIGLRIVNALSVKTFFQPDEYFQSLEPAWEIAFGADSGAWITWVRWSSSYCKVMRWLTMIHRNGRITFDPRSILLCLLVYIGSHHTCQAS